MTTPTIEVRDGDRAIAWRMRAPSASGGKVYTIAVRDRTVITCWGRASSAGPNGPGSQGRAQHYRDHNVAVAAAQQTTAAKENEGYVLDIAPRTLAAPRGGTWYVTDAVALILQHGTPA